MKVQPAGPQEICLGAWRNRSLIGAFVRREIAERYRGSVMGLFWSFMHPLFILTIYTFVFSVVFKLRWNRPNESELEFALVLFAGIMPYYLFAECIRKAPSLILANATYVKKVVFPLEILPWAMLGSALFHFLLSLMVWLVFHLAFFGLPPPTTFLLPVVMLPLLFLCMGLSWFLASLGVYFRDVPQNIEVPLLAIHFLSPVFYPLAAVPPQYRFLIQINPLTPVLEQVRSILIEGSLQDPGGFALYTLSMALVAWLGFAWFQYTRKGFADVL